ncbi:MAG: pyridoxal-phosphate dependent enzyme [Gammaproteobacteria bacterium]|nr:pyridoxal-phosphate dependent enzyme [Gammaproteobacteria bacterium]MDH3411156.1 pyridoxal-phosphate dependent enzyme [Gammaproteobacteria bacterium]
MKGESIPADDARSALAPGIDEVRDAAARIRPYAHLTPVLTSAAIDGISGASVYFKCENFQKVGAFKFRGAVNAIFSLSGDAVARGVATHSSGNHAAAVSLAASLRNAASTVVMPENANATKRAAVEGYGGKVVLCEPSQKSREETLAGILAESGATFIPPYDDYRVIAGQGTAALELLEHAPDLDAILAPVGGGGLLAGTALAASGLSPGTRIFGAEPRAADDAYRSLRAGRIQSLNSTNTIADGLRTNVGKLTFPIILEHVEDILCVTESEIIAAMRLVWERMKIVIEPSAAVPVAALLRSPDLFTGKQVGVILSGGNVDLATLPWERKS